MKNKITLLNAMVAVRKLYARFVRSRERALNTIQQLLVRRSSVMDAIKTLWERRVDAVRT